MFPESLHIIYECSRIKYKTWNLLFMYCQVCIIAMWSVITHPSVREVMTSETTLELMCDFPPGPFITSLSYNVLLLIASVYCAFKTRKLPDNFSESKFIGFCVYSTVVIWLAFIPAYFTVPSAFYQVYHSLYLP